MSFALFSVLVLMIYFLFGKGNKGTDVPNFTTELMKVVDGPLDSMKQRRVLIN